MNKDLGAQPRLQGCQKVERVAAEGVVGADVGEGMPRVGGDVETVEERNMCPLQKIIDERIDIALFCPRASGTHKNRESNGKIK